MQENDAKRNRSLNKAGKERQIVLQKEAEAEELKEQCVALENRLKKLQQRVRRNTLYWTFLEQVLKMAKVFNYVCTLQRIKIKPWTKSLICYYSLILLLLLLLFTVHTT